MAEKTAQAFVEDLERDTSLSTQFYVASPNNLDGVIDFAYGKGYVFSKDDLLAALKRHPEGKAAQQLLQMAR